MNQNKLNYIKRIAKNLAPKSTFDIYDKDDIEQEIYFLVAQAENTYNPEKGDEYTFFFNYVKNRLSTLKRDKYGISSHKMNIANAVSLDGEIEITYLDYFSEYKDIIDEKIPSHFREDYLRYVEGAKLPHRNKNMVIDAIKEIIRIYRLDEDGEG